VAGPDFVTPEGELALDADQAECRFRVTIGQCGSNLCCLLFPRNQTLPARL
jgi:hypothetical protein